MKYIMPILSLTAFLGLCKADNATLADLRKIYESHEAQIKTSYSNSVAAALRDYGTAVEAAKERYREKGDLDGLLGAQKEVERFTKESSCPDTDPKDLPRLIATARAAYRATCADSEQKQSADLIALAKAYESHLTVLEKRHVKQEQLEAAVTVRNEVKRIAFILADLESRVPQQPATTVARTPSEPPPRVPSRTKTLSRVLDGQFYVSVDDTADIFVNGRNIYHALHNKPHEYSKSPETRIQPGDMIAFKLFNKGESKRFLAAFLSADKRFTVSFAQNDFRILPDPKHLNMHRGAFEQLAKSPIKLRKQHKLPFPFNSSSEWVWGEGKMTWIIAMVTEDMIQKTE